MDFWTKDDLNKNWSLYEEESMDTSESEKDKTTSSQSSNTSTFSGKSSPTRDTWDPMLYNINLTSWVELNIDDDVQIRKQPVLETPITPLPGMEDLSMFLAVSLEHSRSRQASMSRDSSNQDGSHHKNYFLQHVDTCSAFLSEKTLGGNLPQKVK